MHAIKFNIDCWTCYCSCFNNINNNNINNNNDDDDDDATTEVSVTVMRIAFSFPK